MNVIDRLGGRWEKPVAVTAGIVGLVLLIAGWVGVSGESLVTGQLPYVVSGAVGALFAAAVAATLWLSSDMRDEFVKLDEIHREIRGMQEGLEVVPVSEPTNRTAPAGRSGRLRAERTGHGA